MEKNYWDKSLSSLFPYLDWESLSKEKRTSWNALRHSNITFELHIILQGSCQIEVGTNHFTMDAGQAVLIRPGIFHSSIDNTEQFTRFTLAFLVKGDAPLSQFFPDEEPFIHFNITPALRTLCYNILEEYDHSDNIYQQEMMSSLLSQFWILLLRSLIPRTHGAQNTVITKSRDIHTIEFFFSSRNSEKCTRKNLAEQLHCSERQVNRILTQFYGMNFRQKKQQFLIDYAKFLLRNTDKKISEICLLVGYTDEAAFYKIFKAKCHMTPQEFRNHCRQTNEAPDT